MFAQLTSGLDFQAKALLVRAERQRVIASNIANADTPGYSAKDVNFKDAMAAAHQSARGTGGKSAASTTHPAHFALSAGGSSQSGGPGRPAYAVQTQPAMDNNSVDMDRERASFVDNAIRYESTLRFINGYSKTILSAIQGQ